MIAKMAKYDFVLYAAKSEDFIEKLRELGLVDITTTGCEPSEEALSQAYAAVQTIRFEGAHYRTDIGKIK